MRNEQIRGVQWCTCCAEIPCGCLGVKGDGHSVVSILQTPVPRFFAQTGPKTGEAIVGPSSCALRARRDGGNLLVTKARNYPGRKRSLAFLQVCRPLHMELEAWNRDLKHDSVWRTTLETLLLSLLAACLDSGQTASKI